MTAQRSGLAESLRRLLRRLLRRPPDAYPKTKTLRLASGRRVTVTIKGPLRPDLWDHEPSFVAPMTMQPDEDHATETVRPRMFPPVAVQIAALRQVTLELAGLLDDDDADQERDRKLLWWFRRERDRAD
jgi:hypothetical protein